MVTRPSRSTCPAGGPALPGGLDPARPVRTVHARHDHGLRARMYHSQAERQHDQAMRERPPGHWSRHLDHWFVVTRRGMCGS